MLVRYSYSKEQLETGEYGPLEACTPLQTFADASRLFKTTIDRPLFVKTAAFNKTYSQTDAIYPCGLRSLTALQRRLESNLKPRSSCFSGILAK